MQNRNFWLEKPIKQTCRDIIAAEIIKLYHANTDREMIVYSMPANKAVMERRIAETVKDSRLKLRTFDHDLGAGEIPYLGSLNVKWTHYKGDVFKGIKNHHDSPGVLKAAWLDLCGGLTEKTRQGLREVVCNFPKDSILFVTLAVKGYRWLGKDSYAEKIYAVTDKAAIPREKVTEEILIESIKAVGLCMQRLTDPILYKSRNTHFCVFGFKMIGARASLDKDTENLVSVLDERYDGCALSSELAKRNWFPREKLEELAETHPDKVRVDKKDVAVVGGRPGLVVSLVKKQDTETKPNCSLRQFIETRIEPANSNDVTSDELHSAYYEFCREMNLRPHTRRRLQGSLNDIMLQVHGAAARHDILRLKKSQRGFKDVRLVKKSQTGGMEKIQEVYRDLVKKMQEFESLLSNIVGKGIEAEPKRIQKIANSHIAKYGTYELLCRILYSLEKDQAKTIQQLYREMVEIDSSLTHEDLIKIIKNNRVMLKRDRWGCRLTTRGESKRRKLTTAWECCGNQEVSKQDLTDMVQGELKISVSNAYQIVKDAEKAGLIVKQRSLKYLKNAAYN